jgi:hypothetical protein
VDKNFSNINDMFYVLTKDEKNIFKLDTDINIVTENEVIKTKKDQFKIFLEDNMKEKIMSSNKGS